MKVYEVIVYLFEGENVSLGLSASREEAQELLEEARDDWASGPNVYLIEILEREIK